MNLSYFKTFLTVVEKKSFSGAAKALNLSQPAISFQIQTIEKEYGEILLDRSGSKIVPTEAGKIFSYFAKEILRANDMLGESLDEFRGIVRGRLKIGASTIPGEYVLPRLLGKFKQKFPEVQPTLEISDTKEIIEKLGAHEIDIGFVGAHPKKGTLKVERFAADELILILPPDHSLKSRKRLGFQEIIKEPFILREIGSGTRKTLEGALNGQGLSLEDLNVTMELGSTQAILTAVEGGLGISILSRWAAKKALKLKTVRTVPLETSISRDLYLIYDERRFLSRAQREFIDFVLGET
ncbi:MAG: selenium metabolism-associated LysR family transcriptional regulator [Actinomycetota bacterium]|nr:selenium metabolism-associated LysR family transcriptional regulator [Actinomycetota bacterium]